MTGLTYIISGSKFDTDITDRVLQAIGDILPHGSGLDGDWNLVMANKTRVRCHGSYHCMDENGMYDGWADFSMLFDLEDGLYFRLMFHGIVSQYKAKKYGLRDYLEDLLCETLHENFGGENISELFS